MKIKVTQTSPNGQVSQQILTKDGVETLKLLAQPNVKFSFNVEKVDTSKANQKAKVGSTKRVGNNLVLEIGDEELLEVVDYYSTSGASVTDIGWDYVAQDSAVVSVTPEALASSGTNDAVGALLPIPLGWVGAGAAGVALLLATGGGSAAASVASNVVIGVIAAGPLVSSHGLSVVLYKADGITPINGTVANSTASMNVSGISGKFSLDIGTYTGVVLAKVIDATANADFKDEATNSSTDITANLLAVGVAGSGTTVININPLTTVAAQVAGVTAAGVAPTGASALTAVKVASANSTTAKAFGLTDVTETDPDTINDGSGTSNSIGVMLAALSGMDAAVSGSQQLTIDTLVSKLKDPLILDMAPDIKAALIAGAARVELSTGTSGLTKTVSDLLASKTTNILTIDNIDKNISAAVVDGIVSLAEFNAATTATSIRITGTVVAGATAVELIFNSVGVAVSATVTGTTWSYTMPASTLGTTDGGGYIQATATLADGITKSSQVTRLYYLNDTDDTPTSVFLNNIAFVTQVENTVITGVPGLKVADIAVIDDGGTPTYTLSGADAASFTISGAALYLKASVVLNYETKSSYAVVVNVNGGASTSYSFVVSDINEAPTTVSSISAKTAVVDQPFTLATAAFFADADAGGLAGGVYTATGLGNGLAINSSTGVISGVALADAAASPVVVTFTDAGGLAVSQATFNLNAVTAPVVQSFTVVDALGSFTKGTSGNALTFAVTFSESVSVTGTVTAVFNVNGSSVTATYAGSGGTAILNFTGGSVPSSGDGTSISLTSITGGTVTGLVTSQSLVAPTAADFTYSGYTVDNTAPSVTSSYNSAENTSVDTTRHTITLAGTDTNGPVTFSGLSGTDAAKFGLNTTTGVLTFAGVTNFESKDDAGANGVYDISVVGTDAAGKTVTQAIAITLTNVNEAPTVATALTDQTAVLNQAFTYSFGAASFADVDASTTLTYSAKLQGGAALSTASGWTNLSFNSSTRTISGTATNETTGDVIVRITASDGTLSVYDDVAINAVAAPVLTTALTSLVTNFDVRSKIVFSVGETVTANAGGTITLTDLGGTSVDGTGFRGEAATHTQTIDITDTTKVQITGSGADTKIILNPEFDLDLSSNYSIAVSTGAFLGSTSGQNSVAFTTVNFSTVTPGEIRSGGSAAAVLSKSMNATTGAMQDSLKWLDVTDPVGSNPSSASYGELNVGAGANPTTNPDANYAIVLKDIDPLANGIAFTDTYIWLHNFGANDLVYIDNQEQQLTAQAYAIDANFFSGGEGTVAVPFELTVSGSSLASSLQIDVDSSVTLPALGAPSYSYLLADINSNSWSNTGIVITG